MSRPLLLASLALAALAAGEARADLVILRDGEELEARVVEVRDGRATLEPADGSGRRQLELEAVGKIELHRDLGGTEAERVDQLDDPVVARALAAVADAEAYPSAGAVNLYLGEEVVFTADGARTRTVRNLVRVLQERGKGEGTVPLTWLDGVEEARLLHGRTYLPDGTVSPLTDKGVRVAPVYGTTPEYDRQQKALHTLPNVDVGSVVDWAYEVRRKPGVGPAFPLGSVEVLHLDEPVVEGEYTLKIHRDLDFVVRLTRPEGVAWTRGVEGDFTVHRFRYLGMVPGKREAQKPPSAEIYPTVHCAPRGDWAGVMAELAPLFSLQAEPSEAVQALLRERLEGEADPAARFQALALWVAREVRLVGVGMGSYQYAPRPVDDILATRTGSYLDKSWLLYALCRAAGLEAELFLIRDRYLGEYPEGVVGAHLFDDALVRVDLPGSGPVFRDADSVDLGPRDLPEAFHGVPAVQATGRPGEVVEVAAPPLEDDASEQVYTTRLEADGTLHGQRKLVVRGNSATTVRGYRNMSAEDLQKRMERLTHSFHPSAELVDFRLQHLDDFTRDVIYERSFRVPRYALRAGGTLLAFKLPGVVDSASDVGQPVRRFPLAFRSRTQRDTRVEVALPEGFVVEAHPEDLVLEGRGWRYTSRCAVEAPGLVFTSRWQRTAWRITPEEYPEYKRAREARARQAEQWVVVARPGADAR